MIRMSKLYSRSRDAISNPAILPARATNRLLVSTILLCIIVIAIVSLPGLRHIEFFHTDYLVFHSVVEIASAIVSFAVFIVGWYGYKANKNAHNLVIGVVFLTVALIDLAHALSYKGMPTFLTENTVSKASTLWISARLVAGAGLVLAGLTSKDSKRAWLRPGVLLATGLIIATLVIVMATYYGNALPPMYIPGEGQTALKIGLEWLAIALFATAIFVFRIRQPRDSSTAILQAALIVSISSELGFSLYKSAFDSYNMLGHVLKAVAYYLIFRALFVSSFERPYRELARVRDQLEESFAKIGTALASSLDLDDVLKLIAELASDMLQSRHALVMLIQAGQLKARAWRGMRGELSSIPIENTSAGHTFQTGKPTIIDDVSQIQGHNPACHCQNLVGPPAKSVVSVPIQSDGRTLGVIEVYSPYPSAFGNRDVELLSSFARQAAVAIKNSLAYERERLVAVALQESVLPDAPEIPGLNIAVRYIPAEDEFRVGGDLYDLFSLDKDRLALVIGDVSGHGLSATSVMALTTLSIRGCLLQGMSPGMALKAANHVLCRYCGETTFVTAFASILDTKKWILQYANAGHHMPLILKNNSCELVELHSNVPLAVDELAEYPTYTADLGCIVGLLFYTDGLIEARNRHEMFGDERLLQMCGREITHPAAQILDSIEKQVRAWSGILMDDIAMLLIKQTSEKSKLP